MAPDPAVGPHGSPTGRLAACPARAARYDFRGRRARHHTGASGRPADRPLADAQTTGGYPRIAQAAAVDLPLIAQVRPGGTLRFAEISQAEAQALYLAREHESRKSFRHRYEQG
ncbi:hypothetical protein RAC89_07410 [Paenibacillus sp. GD4]|nr:hypothetical protein [Paenibacillus sp. GD4]MDQ1910325.1 hypothetical protein [Paenibacillus sp. GD4]